MVNTPNLFPFQELVGANVSSILQDAHRAVGQLKSLPDARSAMFDLYVVLLWRKSRLSLALEKLQLKREAEQMPKGKMMLETNAMRDKVIKRRNKMKKMVVIVTLCLGGCGAPYDGPVVTEYNGDSVTLEVFGHAALMPLEDQRRETHSDRSTKAQEICQRGHKKHAELVSVGHRWHYPKTVGSTYVDKSLYLCLNS